MFRNRTKFPVIIQKYSLNFIKFFQTNSNITTFEIFLFQENVPPKPSLSMIAFGPTRGGAQNVEF